MYFCLVEDKAEKKKDLYMSYIMKFMSWMSHTMTIVASPL